MRIRLFFPFIACLYMLTACSSTKKLPTQIIYIGEHTLPCNAGVMQKQCMQIKWTADQKDWQLFYDQIEGFNYEEGYEYELLISKEKIVNPPADASDTKYTLVKEISKKKVAGNDVSLFTTWKLESFDEPGALMPVMDGMGITFTQKDNAFNGNASCNNIMGNYTLSGNNLKFGTIASTRKMCEHMELESKMIKTLEKTTRYKITGCHLYLFEQDVKLLTFSSCK
ncbi:MAG TPA: DUF4377 domain-containing protein [Chitinophagales bacterium]|nr:DUF4377 domain-containing protein [Chitinophagales bacterium]